MLALLLVFGCSLVFSLGVAADESSIPYTVIMGSSPSGSVVGQNDSVSLPFLVYARFDPSSLEVNKIYELGYSLRVSYSYLNAAGAIVGASNTFVCSSSSTVFTAEAPFGGVHVVGLYPDSAAFYITEAAQSYDSVYLSFSGVLRVSSKANNSSIAKASISVGVSGRRAHLWDSLTFYEDESESLKDAIDKQTEQDKQQHQETMDKIDDVTDFDETEQGSLSGSVGDTQGQLEEKMGLLTWVGDLLSQFLDLFADPGGASLVFPGFSITVDGESYPVWTDTPFDFQTIDDNFHSLLVVVRFSTTVVVYGALVNYLGRVAEAVIHDRPVKEEGGSE